MNEQNVQHHGPRRRRNRDTYDRKGDADASSLRTRRSRVPAMPDASLEGVHQALAKGDVSNAAAQLATLVSRPENGVSVSLATRVYEDAVVAHQKMRVRREGLSASIDAIAAFLAAVVLPAEAARLRKITHLRGLGGTADKHFPRHGNA